MVVELKDEEYGICASPDAEYIKLISSDGFEFIIKREYAILSGTINYMIRGPIEYGNHEPIEIRLHGIPSYVLEIVCNYLTFKAHFQHSTDSQQFHFKPELSLDVLLAAHYLDC